MKKRHTEEQILGILREAEKGKELPDLLRKHGIAPATSHRCGSR